MIEYKITDSFCWEVTSHSSGGAPGKDYPQAYINGKERHLHRYSWEKHRGPIPEGMCVCHQCDNRKCINPSHLFLGTVNDNNQDMKKKKRNRRGAQHHWAKLSEDKVLMIRWMYSKGFYQRVIGKVFGIPQMTVSGIVTRKSWAWI